MINMLGESSPKPSLKQEALAVIGFALALFLLAGLLSYTPEDPSFGQYNTGAARNWVGTVGAHVAALLFDVFGLAVFWLPVLPVVIALRLLKPEVVARQIAYLVLGWLFLLVTTCNLFSLIWGPGRVIIFSTSYVAGGIVGEVMARAFTMKLNKFGAYLVSVTFFILSLMMSTGLSVYLLWHRTRDKMGVLTGKLKSANRAKKAEPSKPGEKKEVPRIAEPVHSEKTGIVLPPVQEELPFMRAAGDFKLPPLSLLDVPLKEERERNKESLLANARLLENRLADFGVAGKVTEICPGPVITMYEFEPAAGVKINRVTSLADDLALALRAGNIRIVAPIPGKSVIGIEIPNTYRESVYLGEILGSEAFSSASSKLTMALGKDIVGQPVVTDLAKMPHLLIAGATGAGKSVFLNATICSILFKSTPDHVRLLMIDPKRIELSAYGDIPHLLYPVVTEPKKATKALGWAVGEMERRYVLLEEKRAKNIDKYNQNNDNPLPYIIIVIDELADLMLVSSHEVEGHITRLAQMARAAGIHLLVATQRPSVDVLTGVIKANFPTRISFQVSSKIDSRTILDTGGAENLLGAGDMLFLPPGTAKLQRIHGAYISEVEIMRVVDFLKGQKEPAYDETILEAGETEGEMEDGADYDEKYEEALKLVLETRQASISMIQRRLRVGYNRAARMIETMEKEGIVGPADGSKPREVLVHKLG